MKKYNTLIIGSGCAGFCAAKRLFDLGITDIALVTEGINMGTSRNTGSDKQTYYKLSLCGSDGDSVREMAQTLFDGGAVNGDIALSEAASSVRAFMHLVELGVPFPTNEYDEYAGYKTDHDPRTRATSCGPLTSKYMTEALEKAVRARNIEIIDGLRVIKILTDEQGGKSEVCGLAAVNARGDVTTLQSENVILATGGPAGIYENSVYPESQTGATGLAIEAGALCANLEEWQYGLASTKFRWNLSGTYMQVLPKFYSVGSDGKKREFLYDALGEKSLDMIFLKGYQWPFDVRKTDGSSRIDLLCAAEIKAGRRVFIDYTQNPTGLDDDFSVLSDEAHSYLEKSCALFGTPIERLKKMNAGAIELYASHDINLYNEPLEAAICAQHCNGGVDVDENRQTLVRGLFCIGEAAGTFGVYRPGGSALNSTQVGALRAAQYIAENKKTADARAAEFSLPEISYGESNVREKLLEIRHEMSLFADFERNTEKIRVLLERDKELLENFFREVRIAGKHELTELFILRDALTTQISVLSAMLFSGENIGSHGSAFVDGMKPTSTEKRTEQTITERDTSYFRPVRPLPDPELWFETLLARQRERNKQ